MPFSGSYRVLPPRDTHGLSSSQWILDLKTGFGLVGFPGGSDHQQVKNPPVMQETQVQSLGQEDTLEKGNGNPLQYSCLETPKNRGALCTTAYGVSELDMTK